MPLLPNRQAAPPKPKRESGSARGYDRHWQRAAHAWLAEHPACVMCAREGKMVIATEVDHIVPHKGDYVRFFDPDNRQSLCHRHHSEKTAREDGGFGR